MLCATFASAALADHPRLLLTASDIRAHGSEWQGVPLFAASVRGAEARLRAHFAKAPEVPTPADPGGGYTHEQHKQNGILIQDAGFLYQWTGNDQFAQYAKQLLLAYADMYPKLGNHPAAKAQAPGRLFWQILNEAVWAVYAIQGYDAIHDFLLAEERQIMEDNLFRPLARFLSVESPGTFDKIHNHGVWAVCAVGMIGYVLGDSLLVEQALLGLKGDGSAGFLKQLDSLFSPDGYYAEGPYYQRYALMPFVLFAAAIEQSEPARKIFEHRDGVLLKAIHATIQLSCGGKFFPINDAIKDKGLDTIEVAYGAAIAYGQTQDPRLLSILEHWPEALLTGDGFRAAAAYAEGKAQAYEFRTAKFRDGPQGAEGALIVLRSAANAGDSAVVFKASSQGMGHGHFDRLNWLYYDNGNEVISDYGAARFLNVVQKSGGRYLPENESWAKQSIAHNVLVVDERSHFGGDLRRAERTAPEIRHYGSQPGAPIASAVENHAYEGVSMRRTLLLIEQAGLERPIVLDLVDAVGAKPRQYDLPLYFQGQIIDAKDGLAASLGHLEPLGKSNGYQHLWLAAAGALEAGAIFQLTWLLDGRFYTYTAASNHDLRILLAQAGAADPNFSLRREQGLILRVPSAGSAAFLGILEPHGEYDGSRERTRGSASSIRAVQQFHRQGKRLVRIAKRDGSVLSVALSFDADPSLQHRIRMPGRSYEWSGFHAIFNG